MHLVRRFLAGRGVWLALIPGLIVLGILLDRERWIGGIAWALLSAYGLYQFGLWFAGPYTLPLGAGRAPRSAARGMIDWFARGGRPVMAVVREGKVLAGPDSKSRNQASGEGAIFVDSTSIVVLASETRPTRLLEPGVHFLREDESIGWIVDLRPQVRVKEIEAQTRDGIWIKCKILARFQIDGTASNAVQDAARAAEHRNAPYKWSPRQVMRAIEQARVRGEPGQPVSWDDLVLDETVKRVHTLVAAYALDQLTEPRDPDANPREDIRRRLEEEVRAEMKGKGVNVLGIGLGQFVPRDKEVLDQRIKAWQADWIRCKTVIEAEGAAESYRLIEQARAGAQMEMMQLLAQALEVSQQTGVDDTEQLAVRLLEVVERLAAQPDVERLLSGESRAALGQLHLRLLEKGSSDGVAAP